MAKSKPRFEMLCGEGGGGEKGSTYKKNPQTLCN